VPIFDHDDQRRSPTNDGEEVRDRGVQTVALGVRVGRDWKRKLTDSLRQIWQQP
jgi:hypothetical protein